MKIDWFESEKYFFTNESVKRQITDSISENLTDSDLESTVAIFQMATAPRQNMINRRALLLRFLNFQKDTL